MYILLSQHVLGCIESGCHNEAGKSERFSKPSQARCFQKPLECNGKSESLQMVSPRPDWHLVSSDEKQVQLQKKESRAAFETVLQQANWQRWKTPTRGIEPLVIWHDDMVCRLTRMIFTYQARGFRGWMSFHHPRCPACFSGISRVCSLNINAESSTKLKPSAALLSLQWRRRTIYRCLKFLLELCLGSVFDSNHTISLILTWCWFIRSWRLFHHLSQVDPHCILFCGPIRSAWRGLAKRLVGCSRGSWSVVRNWIT